MSTTYHPQTNGETEQVNQESESNFKHAVELLEEYKN
jgi:hypothetical protein